MAAERHAGRGLRLSLDAKNRRPQEIMVFFQQYGAQRTGTNYSKDLFNKNYKNLQIIEFLNSKHHVPREGPYVLGSSAQAYLEENYTPEKRQEVRNAIFQQSIKNLVIIRNPYAWIDSLWRIGLEMEHGADSYIYFQQPPSKQNNVSWLLLRPSLEEQAPAVKNSIISYNERYRQWFGMSHEIVRQEDLLMSFERVLEYFEQKYHLHRREHSLTNVNETRGPHIQIGTETRDKNFYKDYYLNDKYMSRLPPNTIKLITETVDWELFKEVGYYPYSRC